MFKDKSKVKKRQLITTVMSVVVFVIASVFAITAYNCGKATSSVVDRVERHFSGHLIMPSETPVATIMNERMRSTDVLFRDAEVGDVVLTYNESGLVVVYRESVDKVVVVAPLVIKNAAQQSAGAVVYVFGDDVGLVQSLRERYSVAKVVYMQSELDVDKNLVYDVDGDRTNFALDVAGLVDGSCYDLSTIMELPEDADIVVLLSD